MDPTIDTTHGGTKPGKVNGTHVPARLWPRVRYVQRRSRLRFLWLLVPLVLAYPIYLGGRALLGVRTVAAGAEPLELPEQGFSYDAWANVLSEHVVDGRVDYPALAAEGGDLRRFAATLAEVGPSTQPSRFRQPADRLAYYLNAYNALAMLGVVAHWPLRTVLEVHGPVEPTAGFGFFWSLRFQLDGGTTSLHDLENGVLREDFGDARIHAALNCATRGCPMLRAEPFLPERLGEQLDAAARAFASQPRHVWVDDEQRQVMLSVIYDWYAEDFEASARQLGAGDTVLDWIRHYATDEVAEALETAEADGYAVTYADYDWTVNRQRD